MWRVAVSVMGDSEHLQHVDLGSDGSDQRTSQGQAFLGTPESARRCRAVRALQWPECLMICATARRLRASLRPLAAAGAGGFRSGAGEVLPAVSERGGHMM